MRLRRLSGIYIVCFLIFTIPFPSIHIHEYATKGLYLKQRTYLVSLVGYLVCVMECAVSTDLLTIVFSIKLRSPEVYIMNKSNLLEFMPLLQFLSHSLPIQSSCIPPPPSTSRISHKSSWTYAPCHTRPPPYLFLKYLVQYFLLHETALTVYSPWHLFIHLFILSPFFSLIHPSSLLSFLSFILPSSSHSFFHPLSF